MYATKCIESDRFELIETINTNHVDIDNIVIKDDIQYIKLLELLSKKNGDKIFANVQIKRFIYEGLGDYKMIKEIWDYIVNMDKTSSIKNYLIVKYIVYLRKNTDSDTLRRVIKHLY